jgi:hypothetical protein
MDVSKSTKFHIHSQKLAEKLKNGTFFQNRLVAKLKMTIFAA